MPSPERAATALQKAQASWLDRSAWGSALSSQSRSQVLDALATELAHRGDAERSSWSTTAAAQQTRAATGQARAIDEERSRMYELVCRSNRGM